MLGLGKSLKWRILFYILITVVVLVLIKHASNATTGWIKDLKNEHLINNVLNGIVIQGELKWI